jgi:hypothetical protein
MKRSTINDSKMSEQYTLLHIEQLPGEQMHLKLEGDPELVAKMIATVMHHDKNIAAAFMACVIEYCVQEGIDCGDLKSMVTIR